MKNVAGEIDKKIGHNLARFRTIRGATRADLGNCLAEPITQQAIAKYENGLSRIPASNLLQFATFLDCKVADLFDGVGDIICQDALDKEIEMCRQDRDMLKQYHRLQSPYLQAAMVNMTKAIVKELASKLSTEAENGKR